MMQNFGVEDLSHVQSRRNLLKYLVWVEMASDWFTRIYRSILAEEINIENQDMACKLGCGLFLSPQQFRRSVIVRKTKYQELRKGLHVNCCDFCYAEDFVGRIGIMLNITPLRSPDIFYNHASRSQKGKILRRNKNACHHVDLASQCSEYSLPVKKMKNRQTKCAFIFIVVRPHGRAKLVPRWIRPRFHQISTSSASSKRKNGQ